MVASPPMGDIDRMTSQNERERVVETLPEVEGGILPEAIARAKAMIGTRMRTENFVRDASLGALLNFVNGIGDTNPIFRDQEYAAYSKYGSIIGHPCAPYMRHWSGRTRWGLPGVHGFFAGNDWEYFRNLRPGDAVNCVERVLDVQERQSRYSETLVIQFVETTYTNQRDELLARVVGWCTRHQRRASRERGKYASVPRRHEYTPEELEAIDQQVLGEKSRGSQTRYFEDTNVGDELEPVVRGPLSLQDVSAFLVGTGRSSAHGVLLREALRHPDHFFRNPEAGGGLEYTGIGPPARLGSRGGGRPRSLRLRPAAGVMDGHAGHQLDGRRRLPQAPAGRMPPLQRLRRHPMVQGPRNRQARTRRRTTGGLGNLGREPARRSDRAGTGHRYAPVPRPAPALVHRRPRPEPPRRRPAASRCRPSCPSRGGNRVQFSTRSETNLCVAEGCYSVFRKEM